ncbi:MAG: hypothetical protein J3Q66DRAFT_161574 [Benniella sp.]|nr:MAG: hypothetical protein J3Q66DRAFT_161574 [Benniella sp.]
MSNKHTETKDASGSKGSEGSMLSAHSTDAGNAKQNTTTRRGDDTLFQFPFKGSARSKSIAVRVEDMSRLKEGEFLNDTLIEFGLKHVHANLESRDSELAENTYIFNSFFYERLVSSSGKGIAYDAVKSWTNKIDLFSKKFIIIPIHENMHWFLAIISNPGLLLSDVSTTSSQSMTSDLNIEPERKSPSPPSTGSAESIGDVSHSNSTPGSSSQTNQEDIQRDGETKSTRRSLRPSTVSAASVDAEAKPYILVLDSLGGPHAGVFKSLRAYLQQELQARKGIQRTIDSKDVPGKLAKCPQQENFCDCGLFVLHYAEAFLNHPGPLLDEIVNKKDESSEYWTADGLALKREKYREIMTSLAEEYKTFLQEQIKIKKANPGV